MSKIYSMSIRLKILAIVLGFFSFVAAAFAVYSGATTANYRQLRTDEVSKTVAFESERVGKIIAEMERNAVDLALAGYHFYLSGIGHDRLGESVSVENFSAFSDAAGGGIWYEPYAFHKEKKRVCYYAFFDPAIDSVRHDPEFQGEEYDYHTQIWYVQISTHLRSENHTSDGRLSDDRGRYNTAWAIPYYENVGVNSLMTTVGAGIYDENGHFIGMASVDLQIQQMVDRLTSVKPTENSFVLLASTRDNYVISNTFSPKETHISKAGQAGDFLHSLPWYEELYFDSSDNVDIGRFVEGGVEYISFSRLFGNGWLFSVQIPSKEIFSKIEARNNRFILIIAGFFVCSLALMFILLSELINKPLMRLTSGVVELSSGNLDKQLEITSSDEIGILAVAFNEMTVDLRASIETSVREHAEKERIGAELNVAAQIQASMLPSIFPAFPHRPEFDIYALMNPAKEVGGDFYDFFFIDENRLAVIIADVSGKGVPAALFMVISKTLIKNNAQYGKSAKEVFETVNNLLCENNETSMFVTAFMGVLDIQSGRFIYANAGHNLPLVKLGGSDFKEIDSRPALPLAMLEDTEYPQDEITLCKGDVLYFYTDGVTEATNRKNELFTEAKLITVLNCTEYENLKDLLISIKNEIGNFANGAEQADDITMLAIKLLA